MQTIEARKYNIHQSIDKIDSEAVLSKIEAILSEVKNHPVEQNDENDLDTRIEKAADLLLEDYQTDEELTAFSVLDGEPYLEVDDKVWEAVKPTRKGVTIDQMIKEQNYKPIVAEEFFKEAAELNIEEPIEDLLAMLTP
ncbi:MAG: hypothetical protein AAGI23_09960 [Bacteroidota bacterium]